MRARLAWTLVFGASSMVLASALAGAEPASADTRDQLSPSVLGKYLAGRFARGLQDTENAADFYGAALDRDPANDVLLEQAFQMETMSGNWQKAIPLAERLASGQQSHRLSHFLLGVSKFRDGDFGKAEEHFKSASENPIGELTSALARGWTKLAAGDATGALSVLDMPKQPDWAQFYLRYHKALIADIAGRKSDARAAFDKMFKQDGKTLRTSLAYAQHAASHGDTRLAKQIISEQLDKSQNDPHPLARDLKDKIEKGTKISRAIATPADGLSEVFYGLGEALTGEGGVSLGTIYLQMALFAKPDHTFALAALASAQESAKRYQDAISTYEKIPKGSALQSAIDIRKAFNLNSLEKSDDAKVLLEEMVKREPKDIRPLEALGDIMRTRKDYAGAVNYFSKTIDLIKKPDQRHWRFYYARGTAYERLKNWPAAETDLKRALALAPDQPLVLNYLGYSWIDQGKNMKEGMRLIEKAVQLKPDDGYIVDSLGWAHFKQGNFKEAVRYLERAVEIRPEDPTLNDHLGDAFWTIGREREARFQWSQAITLNPEPEDLAKIKAKLENGLPRIEAKPSVKEKQAERYQPSRRRSENRTGPQKRSVQ